MQTELRTSGDEYHCWRRAKKVVIVVEGKTDHINDIIDSIIIPREVSADHTLTLCAVGTVDDGQYREIFTTAARIAACCRREESIAYK